MQFLKLLYDSKKLCAAIALSLFLIPAAGIFVCAFSTPGNQLDKSSTCVCDTAFVGVSCKQWLQQLYGP
jgi:hypothetical protein